MTFAEAPTKLACRTFTGSEFFARAMGSLCWIMDEGLRDLEWFLSDQSVRLDVVAILNAERVQRLPL